MDDPRQIQLFEEDAREIFASGEGLYLGLIVIEAILPFITSWYCGECCSLPCSGRVIRQVTSLSWAYRLRRSEIALLILACCHNEILVMMSK
jgi:hypothetical protein